MTYRILTISSLLALVVSTATPPSRAQTCAGVSPASGTALTSVTVASGLISPVFVASPPGDTDRLFIVEQAGRIKIRRRGETTASKTFLDIASKVDSSAGELGLLGFVFDPDYATTGHFWVNYTETVLSQHYTVVARYSVDSHDPEAADPLSEVRTIRIPQPEDNHNGGMLAFGPDGFLYIFMGDGGGGGDYHGTCGNGQDRTVLLAKVLRLDVRGVDPNATAPDCGAGGTYGVPLSNPFRDGVGVGSCDEIWSYGVRNPWRSSFDPATGDLYVADVGEGCWEEVNWTASGVGGLNYGWRVMEGTHCFNLADLTTCTPAGAICAGSPPCDDPGITLPVVEYQHSAPNGCAIVGGYVYRGCKMPAWAGAYFYSDFCSGFVRTFTMSGGAPTNPQDVTTQVDPSGTFHYLVGSFGQDAQGELYIALLNGQVKKLVPAFPSLEVSGPGSANQFRLSKLGDWTWEDLYLATDVPVNLYRVYRGSLGGAYSCVFKATSPKWPGGGDPAVPAAGQLFAYVVSAVNAAAQETQPGTTGTFNAATCP